MNEVYSDGGKSLGETITARVRYLLAQRGKTLEWLAAGLGLSEVTLQGRLHRGHWTPDYLGRTAAALEVEPHELLLPLARHADQTVLLPLVLLAQRHHLLRMMGGDPGGEGWKPYLVAVRQVLTLGHHPAACVVLEWGASDPSIGRLRAGDHVLAVPLRPTERTLPGPVAWGDGRLLRLDAALPEAALAQSPLHAWRLTRLLSGAI